MSRNVLITQAFNKLCEIIEGIRFLPSENNKIQRGVQLLATAIEAPVEEVKKEVKKKAKKKVKGEK